MDRRVIVMADVPIPYGAEVLVRGCRASLAPRDLVNARVVRRPIWLGEEEIIPARRTFAVEMLDRPRDLQALADGPIMNATGLFLPAGRISWAEAKAREDSVIVRCPV